MNDKLVSVIMPAYNGEDFIEKAVQSMLGQSYSNWELIVVDDGSTDKTASIIKSFTDPRIIYVYQENRGQASALNHGLSISKGDYITTLDTDDWFTVNSIMDRVQFLNQHSDFGVVYGDGIYCDVDAKPLMRFSEHRINNVTGDVFDILITTPFFGTGGNVMVRRDVIGDRNIQYDESIVWCQDYDIYIRIAEYATFGVIDAVTIWYRLHEANMTMSMPKGRRLESYIRMKYKVLSSSRFLSVSEEFKGKFFYWLLVFDLAHRVDEQTAIIKGTHFRGMSKPQQVRLLRLVANNYLMTGEEIKFAKELLLHAWLLQPFGLKTLLALFLAYLHPGLSKWVLNWRQQRMRQNRQYNSPLQMARKI